MRKYSLDQRYYNPQLIWSKFMSWCIENTQSYSPPRQVCLQFFLEGKEGYYRMHNPKLYYNPDSAEKGFTSCYQYELWENR